MLEYFHETLNIQPKFNGNTPPYQQSLMEILHHTNKGSWKYSTIPPKFNGNTPTYHQILMEILQHTTKV
jgi:surface antigen